MTADTPRPWYTQFWPWLLIAIPAATVIAGIATIWLASREPVALVVDDYYKEGLAVNRDLAKHRLASERGLSAALAFDGAAGTVQVTLQGRSDPPALTLTLVHPLAMNQDRSIPLQRSSAGHYGAQAAIPDDRWYMDLEGADGGSTWRLSGEIDLRTTRRVTLSSAAP
jgi:hypothetical protein